MIENNNLKENKYRIHIITIAVCLLLFATMIVLVKTGTASVIDDPIRSEILSWRTDWLTSIMKTITYLGNWQIITLICLILLAIRKTRKTYGVPLSIGALGVSLANKGLKALIMRPRPDIAEFLIEQGGWSFPSGHSITSMFFFGMAIWLIRKNVQSRKIANVLTVLLTIPLVLIGVSRVYLGVHYPTDVLAGWCLGMMAIALVTGLIKIR